MSKELLYGSDSSILSDPYLGFSYDNQHSSTFNIVRVSNGSRFEENLLPPTVDKALEVPGRDGKILQNTQYGPRNIKVDFAFDSLSLDKVRKLKTLLGAKKIAPLVFDEQPDRTWYAKITGSNILKFIPFDSELEDVYKGEGTINFICYDPFSHRKAENEVGADQGRLGDDYDHTYVIEGINDGDKEAGFQLMLAATFDTETDCICDIYLNNEKKMRYKKIETSPGDEYIVINSEISLTEGADNLENKTGFIYDKYLFQGNYFKIPVGEFSLGIRTKGCNIETGKLKFDCLYF